MGADESKGDEERTMAEQKPIANTICHIEIPVANLDRAARFYTEVFGWKIQMMPQMNYADFSTPTGEAGGLDASAKPSPEGVKIYMVAENIPKTLERIEKAGGKTVQAEMSIGEHGFIGLFRDTEGNALGLWRGCK